MTLPHDFIPVPGTPFALTAAEVIAWFLGVNRHWFTMKENALYGRKRQARKALLDYLLTGKRPMLAPEGYVVGKFRTEVEYWFRRRGE